MSIIDYRLIIVSVTCCGGVFLYCKALLGEFFTTMNTEKVQRAQVIVAES